MKETDYSKKKDACQTAVGELNALTLRLKHLPQQFKERIKQLAAEIEGHDLEQYRGKLFQPFGDYTTLADLLMIIKDATGYIRWEGSEKSGDEKVGPDAAMFRDQYRIDVKDEDLKYFEFRRNARSRDDLWLISITAMPGRMWVSLDTDRVQWEMQAGGGPLVENHKFAAALKKEMAS